MSCERCGSENERGARFCASCGAPQRKGAAENESGPVIATLSPERVRVAAGADAQLAVRVRNLAEVVDRYDLRVDGVAAAWAAIEPSVLRLLPDEEGEAAVTVAPPRSYAVASGEVALEVRVDARAESGWTVARAAVEVGPFEDLRPRLVPERARARRKSRHGLTVENHGNANIEALLSAVDPDDALKFALPPSIAVPPGESRTVEVLVRASERHMWGRPVERPFTVALALPSGAEVKRAGGLSQRPVIPMWLIIGVLAAVALIIFVNALR